MKSHRFWEFVSDALLKKEDQFMARPPMARSELLFLAAWCVFVAGICFQAGFGIGHALQLSTSEPQTEHLAIMAVVAVVIVTFTISVVIKNRKLRRRYPSYFQYKLVLSPFQVGMMIGSLFSGIVLGLV